MYLNTVFEEAGISTDNPIQIMHGSDIDGTCKLLLSDMQGPRGRIYKHVFGDLADRFLAEHVEHINTCLLATSAPPASVMNELYTEMQSYLQSVLRDGAPRA